jgi:hypothetical protein
MPREKKSSPAGFRYGDQRRRDIGDRVLIFRTFWKGEKSNGLVFSPHIKGGCYHASVIRLQILKPAGEAIGLPELGWHVYKHTYRSLLDETGAPVCVQQKLIRCTNAAATTNVDGNASSIAKQKGQLKSRTNGDRAT